MITTIYGLYATGAMGAGIVGHCWKEKPTKEVVIKLMIERGYSLDGEWILCELKVDEKDVEIMMDDDLDRDSMSPFKRISAILNLGETIYDVSGVIYSIKAKGKVK